MKKFSSLIGGIVLGTTLLAGQSYAQSTSQPPYGRGDLNQDGVCDVTGNPVGQGRTQGRGQGRSQGGTNIGANCPYGNPGAGQNTGGQNQRGAGQNRGGMGRGAGRR